MAAIFKKGIFNATIFAEKQGGEPPYVPPEVPAATIDGTGVDTPTLYPNTDWNPNAFTAYAKLTRATANVVNADEMQIYIGANDFRERVQVQLDGNAANIPIRLKIRNNNADSISLDYNTESRYLPKTNTYLVRYDGTTLFFYWNGILVGYDNSAVIPTTVDGIAVGRSTSGILTTNATEIDFKYWDSALTDAQAREVCRNTEMIDGLTNDPTQFGIWTGGSQSVLKGASTITATPTFTNAANMYNLALDNNYKAFAAPHMDATNNALGSLAFEATAAGTSYIGFGMDDMAASQDWFSVGAAEGSTSFKTDWVMYAPYNTGAGMQNVMRDLPFFSFLRLLFGMQAGTIKAWWNHQSASDAVESTTETVYKNNFTEYATEARAIHGAPLPLIMAGKHAWSVETGTVEAEWNNLDTWRDELVTALGNGTFIDNSDIPERSGDPFHPPYSEFGTLGGRASAATLALI